MYMKVYMLVLKCIYPKSIFAKCTRLVCFLSLASLLFSRYIQYFHDISIWYITILSKYFPTIQFQFQCFKKTDHQWAAMWACLSKLVVPSPSRATPTGFGNFCQTITTLFDWIYSNAIGIVTIEDDFDRRHLGSVSLRRLLQKEPKYLLLQLSLKMAELGKSSFHRSADRCQLKWAAQGNHLSL